MDELDLPNFRHFPVHFVEHFDKPRYPAENVDSNTSPLVFPWVIMKAQLDGVVADWVTKRYLKEDGREGKCSRFYYFHSVDGNMANGFHSESRPWRMC